jgi:hypothetical protein
MVSKPGNHRIQALLFSIFNVVEDQRSPARKLCHGAIAMILPFATHCTISKVPARCRRRRNEGGEKYGLAIADGLTSASNAPRPILKSSFQAHHKTPTLR